MNRKWWVLTAVACGTFMATLDASIVNIALPTLVTDLETDLPKIKWVVVVYYLVITCLMLPFGRLSDQFGRKLVFGLGFLIFTVGSVACGFSENLFSLILSRCVQGAGASMLMANGPAIITAGFPTEERGKALGILAMVVSIGLISGPGVGGFLIEYFGWRSIFLVNAPVGLAGMALVYRYVQKDRSRKKSADQFDWAGSVIQLVVLFCVIMLFDPPTISVSGSRVLPIARWPIAVIAAILAAVFVKVESQAKSPLLDFELLKNRTFWTANLSGFLMFVAYSAVFVLMPFYLEEVKHYSTDEAGLLMTAVPALILIVAPISGRMSDRIGSQELSFLGAMGMTLSLFAMGGAFTHFGLAVDTSKIALIFYLGSAGFSLGLFQSPNNNAIMGTIPMDRLGTASAFLATVRNLGLFVGAGLATEIFSWQRELRQDFVDALKYTYLVGGIVGAVAMVSALGKTRGAFWNRHGLEKKGKGTQRRRSH